MDLLAIFLTGLTTGGLTCLAIQGGLLATALTQQVQVEKPGQHKHKNKKTAANTMTGVQFSQTPWPVVAFLVTKLLAYTAVGFLLGALGEAVQITPAAQAAMQILAGLFMLATALNMMNVHPVFRYVVIQPPKFLTRMIRKQAKSGDLFTPALLGALTIFIPCGTTQAMEILAISSGSAWTGAAIMFVFVLGTSPTFFVLGFLATQIRGKFQPIFMTATAILILVLGVVSLDAGLNLVGSPLAPSRVIAAVIDPNSAYPPIEAVVVGDVQELTVNAYSNGYSPNRFIAQRDMPIRLKMVTDNTWGCALAFVIPALGIQTFLPETGETVITLPAQQPGEVLFTCSMGMYTGSIRII